MVLELRAGFALTRVRGRGAKAAFAGEPGGHRWQRVPPSEKRGRVHTSTVTVAVLDEPTEVELALDERDLEEAFVRGSGKGGQHRNTTSNAVQLVHRPSGVRVHVDGGRSLKDSRRAARALLRARLLATERDAALGARERTRRQQVGSGMRADKVRTVQVQNGRVVDHRTGKRTALSRYLKGDLDALR